MNQHHIVKNFGRNFRLYAQAVRLALLHNISESISTLCSFFKIAQH
jgi:hypothetical protein